MSRTHGRWKWSFLYKLRSWFLPIPTVVLYMAKGQVEQALSDCPGIRVVIIDYDAEKYPPEQARYVLNSKSIVVVEEHTTHVVDTDIDALDSIISDLYKQPIK